ncbi:hypothetical protein M569_15507 [Genlisea aurea]|uniref:Uncharacterized protein n=1 Tax=Genlisea aurea TaxID=192259 RepID=S8DIM5_9LAMI|nr:hypothetical protein M569_15507 [Genlisea aurea]
MVQDQEIAAASEKLAECQETIINLGKQLNSAITAPPEPPSEVSSNPTAIISRRSSLIHKILVEDTAGGDKKESGNNNLKPDQTNRSSSHPDDHHHIVPHKANGNRSGILLKLFGRNKKGTTENNTLKLLEAVLKSKR